MKKTTITKSELAQTLGVSRSRVSQYVKCGMPVEPDGRIDEAAAAAWVKTNVVPEDGGWGQSSRLHHKERTSRRHHRRAKPARQKAQNRSLPDIEPMELPGRAGDWRDREHRRYFFRSGAMQLLNALLRLSPIAAEIGLDMGLSPEEAFCFTALFEILIGNFGASLIGEDVENVIQDLPEELDLEAWGRFIERCQGVTFDPDQWQERAFGGFDKYLDRLEERVAK
jgi:hypothetical protein